MDNVRERARRANREQFIAAYPILFLIGKNTLERPPLPQGTLSMPAVLSPMGDEGPTGIRALVGLNDPTIDQLLLPIRKVQNAFPSMITVGRTANNDVVIPDVNVSRFHAFFREQGDRMELGDAGSANGTFVTGRKLKPRGPVELVTPGIAIRFGHALFQLLDAGMVWDLIRGHG